MDMQVGDLTATHIGQHASLDVEQAFRGADGTVTSTVTVAGRIVRVQHDGYPVGEAPPQTMVSLGSWGGTLDPTHTITLGEAV